MQVRLGFPRVLSVVVAGAVLGLPVLPRAAAQVPVVPAIPDGFPDFVRTPATESLAPLRARVDKLVADGLALNQRCAKFEIGTALEASCRADVSAWQAERSAAQKLADAQRAQMDFLADLVAQHQDLTRQIEGNLARINEMGMRHREQDFEDWVGLASGARDEFTAQIKKAATQLAVAQAQKGILATVQGISPGTEDSIIQTLDSIHPRPTAVITAVRRMATNESRKRLASDAEFVVDFIQKTHTRWTAQTTEQMQDVAFDLLCAVSPGKDGVFQKQCEVFASEAKVLSAELYYGITTAVAKQQVASLVNLTQDQLKAIAARTQILVDQVKKRKEVRARIEAILNQMQENNSEL
jgi:hypothetical protein